MAELTTLDVEEFTGGRLDSLDPNVKLMLDAALVSARRQVGWHVSPVLTDDTIVLDGPDSRILNLPTRKLVALTSVTEDGTSLDISTLRWSAGGPPGLLERPAAVRKRSRGFWSCEYQGISVVMDHGYTETEAADWRQAVLSMVVQMSMALVTTGVQASNNLVLTRKQVDDVEYTWGNPFGVVADDAVYSVNHVLADYQLPSVEFL